MINPAQLKSLIIEPTLKAIDAYSPVAVSLLLGTCAVESAMGCYLAQIKGPALGIFQMEGASFRDIVNNYLIYRPELLQKVAAIAYPPLNKFSVNATATLFEPNQLIGNLYLACAFARLQYLRSPIPLPSNTKAENLGKVWKSAYNTEKGKGSIEGYVEAYSKFGLDRL